MWKLFFTAWLVHVVCTSPQVLTESDKLEKDLEAEFDRIAEEILSSLKEAHSPPLHRQKRDLSSKDSRTSFIDENGVYRLRTITPVSYLCYPAVSSKFVDVGDSTYAICVTKETQDTPAEVIVGLYEDHAWHPITRWFVELPNSVSAFHFNGLIYVLVADSGKVRGTDLVKIDLSSNITIVDHTVYSKSASSNSIWKMKNDDNYHMAIGNLPGHSTNLTTDVFVYEWMGTYFDKYATLTGYDVKDIEAFHIHDTSYLAIANYRKSLNNFEIDSEIFRFNLDEKGWVPYQKIRTYGATDLEFFSLGSGIVKEFFLAIANKEDNEETEAKSMIYKFAKDIFVPFQCLPVYKASSLASWTTDFAFLLAVASFDDAVHLFQYDGWRFVQSRTSYTQGAMSYGVNSLIFHNITRGQDKVPVLSVNNPEHSRDYSVFEIGFQHENALQAWTTKSTEWCYNTLRKVEATDTDSLIRALDDVLYVDQVSPIVIEGDVYFEKGFQVSKLQTPKLKEIVTQEVYDSSMLIELADINRRLNDIETKLQSFEEVVNNSLKLDGNQTVYGRLKFQDVDFDCKKHACRFDEINTTFLNSYDITDWSKNLVFLDSGHIDGTIIAEKIQAESINVLGLIDGVDSKTLVTKSGSHMITGHKTFKNDIITNELEVYGKVDGVTISPKDVLLTTGYQNITGDIVFQEIDTTWLEVTGLVNGIDFSTFLNDIVRSDQQSIVTGEKVFHDIVVDELKMASSSTINGVDLADLWENAMWKDKNQKVLAPMTFHDVTLQKNLNVPLGINGISIPGPRVVDIKGFANISAPHTFKNLVKISHLEVLNSLNGLGMLSTSDSQPQLDIMLKSGNQVITGKKTFHTIHLDSDSHVSGTVDGVDLSELMEITLRKDSVAETNRTWVFKNLVIKGSLTVDKVSGYDLDSIYERALKLTDTEIPDLIFKNLVYIDDLESNDINGINVRRDLVLTNEPQVITGTKTFREIVLEDNNLVVGTINNINVSFLNETILRIGDQVLKSKVFNKNVKVNKLTVKGSINNVPVSEFVTLKGEDTILNARELKNVTFRDIDVNNLEVAGTVNGIDIEKMIQNTLTYEGDQEVKGTLTVKGTINVATDTDLKVGTINGVDISNLWEDAVLLDVPQEISGEKIFKDTVVFNNLDFKDTIDGVSTWDMSNWMLKNEHQVVEGDVTFINDLSVDNIRMTGLINNINITELDASVVKLNEPAVIEGPIVFENTVMSLGDITLSGKIQGIDLSEEAVTKSGDKVITGIKTFTQDLIVEGDVSVEGKVDGVSIADICENTLLVRKEQNITHLTIKGDVTLSGESLVGGKIGGFDFKELRDIVVLDDGPVVIEGHKVFKNLTIDGPVTIEGKFGGVDLKELHDKYMSLTKDQEIVGDMNLEEVIINGVLTAKNFNSENNLVNGIDIKDLNERVLKVDGTQKVTAKHHFDEIIFADDVFVAGKVNGLEVPAGLMRRDKPNYIQSPKIFERPVTILGDLDMDEGAMIQGVDVSEWNKKAVLKLGKFNIKGRKTFKSLAVNDAKVEGLLDGLRISEDSLLMTYGDQVVTGQKIIRGNVEVMGSVTVNGLVNGVDLNNLSSTALRKDRVNTVTGAKYFTEPLTIHSLEAPTIAGVDVVELKNKINTRLDYELVQNRLEEIEGVISTVKEAIGKQAVIFQYYELFQKFNIPRAYSWFYISSKDSGERLLLSDNSSSTDSCSTIRIFNYDKEQQQFFPHPQELQASFAASIKSLVIDGKTYLFVANQNPKSWCKGEKHTDSDSECDIYVWAENQFLLFQTITLSPLVNMEVFTDGTQHCVIFLEIRSSSVYCLNSGDGDFQYSEDLPTIGGRKVYAIQSHGKIILAISTEDLRPRSIYYVEEKNVDIYFWNSQESTFSKPVQEIPSTFVQSLLLMNHTTEYSNELFLVIAAGKIPNIQEEPKISIYRYDVSTERFSKYQEIKENGELEWITLQTGELVLFILDKQRGVVQLYEYKGVSGFVLVDTIKSVGAVSIRAFIRNHDPEDSINHYLALAGPHALVSQPTQGVDYAKILKSKVKGRRYFINH